MNSYTVNKSIPLGDGRWLLLLNTTLLVFPFNRNSMHWTRAHDTLLSREVLALEPYRQKKGSNEAGKIWTDLA